MHHIIIAPEFTGPSASLEAATHTKCMGTPDNVCYGQSQRHRQNHGNFARETSSRLQEGTFMSPSEHFCPTTYYTPRSAGLLEGLEVPVGRSRKNGASLCDEFHLRDALYARKPTLSEASGNSCHS